MPVLSTLPPPFFSDPSTSAPIPLFLDRLSCGNPPPGLWKTLWTVLRTAGTGLPGCGESAAPRARPPFAPTRTLSKAPIGPERSTGPTFRAPAFHKRGSSKTAFGYATLTKVLDPSLRAQVEMAPFFSFTAAGFETRTVRTTFLRPA